MSQAGSISSSGGGGGGITTIDGDSGSITGTTVTISGGTTGLTTTGSGTTMDIIGTLDLASGGTSANLTASDGGIFYSTASTGAILSGTATADQILQSGTSTAPTWSTSTYPSTTTANEILYASSSNVVGQIATANNGVLITSNSGVPSLLANSSTPSYVLTANSGAPPSWQAPASGGITSIDGDSGSITGSSVTIFANNATQNSGSSVAFVNSGTTSTLNVTDIHGNTVVGSSSGNASLVGISNTIFGSQNFQNSPSGTFNCFFGHSIANSPGAFTGNCAFGYQSSTGLTGDFNSAFGHQSLSGGAGGSYNTSIGYLSGNNYNSSESSNILIGTFALGTPGESNVLRIGRTTGTGTGDIATSYIAGITGATYSAVSPVPAITYLDTSNGQLVSSQAVVSSTATSTFGSLVVSTPLQNTANYSILVNVSIVVASSTSATIVLGVDSSATPSTNPVVTTFSTVTAETFSFSAIVPSKYYMLVDTTGTISVTSITTQTCAVG